MNNNKLILIVIVAVVVMGGSIGWYQAHGHPLVTLAMGIDWSRNFKPAAQALLAGRSPYVVQGFYNPPWTLALLAPLAILPGGWGYGLLAALNLAAFAWTAMRLKVQAAWILPFLVFLGPLLNSFYGNIDGLISLGLVLPPPLGLLFVMMKPQVGFPVALFWAIEAFRVAGGGWRGVGKTMVIFVPLCVALIVSVLMYGLWFAQAGELTNAAWNSSPWPRGIPLGVFGMGLAIWKRDLRWALMAIPFLTPYLTLHTWAFAWMGALMGRKSEVNRVTVFG